MLPHMHKTCAAGIRRISADSDDAARAARRNRNFAQPWRWQFRQPWVASSPGSDPTPEHHWGL